MRRSTAVLASVLLGAVCAVIAVLSVGADRYPTHNPAAAPISQAPDFMPGHAVEVSRQVALLPRPEPGGCALTRDWTGRYGDLRPTVVYVSNGYSLVAVDPTASAISTQLVECPPVAIHTTLDGLKAGWWQPAQVLPAARRVLAPGWYAYLTTHLEQ